MAETHQKAALTTALIALRVQMQNEAALLRRKLDMKQLLEFVKKHPWEWASCAAIVGWLLSRIPARKKKIYIDKSSQKPVKRRDKGRSASFGEKFGSSPNRCLPHTSLSS
jgi:hypothetical protein